MVSQMSMNDVHCAAVMVRAHGPDPKGKRTPRHAFFQTESGNTTLSASGFLSLRTGAVDLLLERKQFDSTPVPISSAVVVTCGSIVEPFLSHFGSGDIPRLISGAEIDVLVEVLDTKVHNKEHLSQRWIPASLECVVDIPAAGAALQMLLDIHGGTEDGAWEVGWSLAPVEATSEVQSAGAGALSRRATSDESKRWVIVDQQTGVPSPTSGVRVGNLARAATRVAVLSLSGNRKAHEVTPGSPEDGSQRPQQKISVSSDGFAVPSSLERGDSLLAIGSPFGALSPLHFHNSVSAGVVSNCWPPRTNPAALIMADIRCLPGMEGGPVFDSHGALAGMVMRPLKQRGGIAEVQLVMTSAVLTPALHLSGVALGVPIVQRALTLRSDGIDAIYLHAKASSLGANPCRGLMPAFRDDVPKPKVLPDLKQALKSVVLVTIGDAAWASGVIISLSGFILTNAHLLEPWRFGKNGSAHRYVVSKSDTNSTMVFGDHGTRSCSHRATPEQIPGSFDEMHGWDQRKPNLVPSVVSPLKCSSVQSSATMHPVDLKLRSYSRIRVRLDHLQEHTWRSARAIYVSQGPLDVALLQLIAPPHDLCPIVPEVFCPPSGSSALVIGHGLFGPRAELPASVSAGVVAKVVTIDSSPQSNGLRTRPGDHSSVRPAMLQTTAAVHQGGSGGAVVNSQGRMIGLVTSNARHGGGRVIPFLNFSVPFGSLAPIFNFVSEGGVDLGILSQLDKPDKSLSTVWALVPSTPRKPDHTVTNPTPLQKSDFPLILHDSPQEGQNGPPKGHRFTKFLTERSAEFGFQSPLDSVHSQTYRNTQSFPTPRDPQLYSSL